VTRLLLGAAASRWSPPPPARASTISGAVTWVLATLIVWLVVLVASLLLPLVVTKRLERKLRKSD
jgi:Flp pilus assembly protein TadB